MSVLIGNTYSRVGVRLERAARATAIVVLCATAAACAGAYVPALPAPAEIPELEAAIAEQPSSVPTLVRLGVAYREAGRLDGARNALERAVTLNATDPAAVFYLGLTYEDLELPGAARQLYTRYIEIGNRDDLKRTLRARLPALERQELLLAAREAIAREAELAATPPRAGTVAVFPFAYEGADPQYRPLGRALAEMMVTDLSQTERLTVLERTRVQLLIDEMDLGETSLVDSLTAARSGRLVGAERIVQGQVNVDGETQLRLRAAIVGAATGQLAGRPLEEQDALRQLFDMQKRLALGVYSSLGIELTAAERERITQIPTQSLDALLAWGQCLEAEDIGDFAAAADFCAQAATFDPAFALARVGAERASNAAASIEVSIAELASLGAPEIATPGGPAATLPGLEAVQAIVPPELPRAPVPEALGTDAGRSTTIDLIIRRP
jgi:TolB-like protein